MSFVQGSAYYNLAATSQRDIDVQRSATVWPPYPSSGARIHDCPTQVDKVTSSSIGISARSDFDGHEQK